MADRLKVMMKPKHGGDELTPMLCTAQGVSLPGQTRLDITTAVGEPPRVTVEFGGVEFDTP